MIVERVVFDDRPLETQPIRLPLGIEPFACGPAGCDKIAISRKDALRRLAGLAPQVEAHLEKVARDPESEAVPHWTGEIHTFLDQMRALLPHVGRKTRATWLKRLEGYREALGESGDAEE